MLLPLIVASSTARALSSIAGDDPNTDLTWIPAASPSLPTHELLSPVWPLTTVFAALYVPAGTVTLSSVGAGGAWGAGILLILISLTGVPFLPANAFVTSPDAVVTSSPLMK